MGDLPNSPYLDRPLRTLREVEEQRWAAACEALATFQRTNTAGALAAYTEAMQAWTSAHTEACRSEFRIESAAQSTVRAA